MIRYLLALVVGVMTQITAVNAADFVQVTTDNVNIRVSASSDARIVGQAAKDMVFKLVETKDAWHQVVLPTGEYRYIHSSLGAVVDDAPQLTESEAVLRVACKDWTGAERRSNEESQASEPDIMKQIDLSRLLSDKYKLVALKAHGISPARSTELTIWCVSN